MSSAIHSSEFRCSARRAVQSVIEGPNWTMNLLWLSLAVLLQQFIVGTIYTFGYGAEIIQTRAGLPGRSNPDIDSNRIGDTFMRGLWPFLVYLLSAMVVGLIVTIPILIVIFAIMFLVAGSGEPIAAFSVLLILPLVLLSNLFIMCVVGPLCIRAMICQDFQKSFDFAWVKSFIGLMLKDMILSSIKLTLLAIPIVFIGFALFCVGMYPAMGLITAASFNLMSQWYELFLIRGGEPVVPGDSAIIDANLV